MRRWALAAAVLLFSSSAHLSEADTNLTFIGYSYFLGYETEPSMDSGGRMIASLDAGASSLGGILVRRTPALAAVYEIPLALALSTVQHEVFGHGGRGREFNLDPSFGFGYDLGAWTSINNQPETVEQLILVSGAGTEANGILADRLEKRMCLRDQTPAGLIPLMFFAKMDLTLYTLMTSEPDPGSDEDSFESQYQDGNDIANYLVSRQGQRSGADPHDVWYRYYPIDFDDPLLQDNWDAVRAAAIWNGLDPMLWASMAFYVKDHLVDGRRFATPPVIPLGDGFGFSLGTRAALDPQSVTRFLDLYLTTGRYALRVYGRDLDSSLDTTYGYGCELLGLSLGGRAWVNVSGDYWTNPQAAEGLYTGDSWNVCAELEVALTERVHATLKAGHKTDGFLPGTPIESGPYWGGGLLLSL